MSSFGGKLGYDEPFIYSTPQGQEREELRFELEALLCHVYSRSTEEFEQLFSTFNQIKQKDMNEHGYFRTREEIKARFDELSSDITNKPEVEK